MAAPPPTAANITATLRDAISRRDVAGIAHALETFRVVEPLAAALVINDTERETILKKTPNRQDADVVTIKGIAKAALHGGESPIRLAEIVVSSMEPSGTCNIEKGICVCEQGCMRY